MKTTKILVIQLIMVLLVGACKKYEDGPSVSLRSRSERIANNWRVESANDNGNDVTGSFQRYEVTFSKGGNATLVAHYSFLGIDYDYSTSGTWSFESNEEKIKVDYENNLADATYLILRLKEKELWLRQEGTNLEIHLVPS